MKLHKIVCILLATSLLGCFSASAQPPDPPRIDAPSPVDIAQMRQGSVYQTLATFIDEHNKGNWQAFPDLIEGAERDTAKLAKAGADIHKSRGTFRLSYRNFDYAVENGFAMGTIDLTAKNHLGLSMSWRESLKFHWAADGLWRMVVGPPNLAEWRGADGYLQQFAMLIAHPKEMQAAFQQGKSARQVKQLMLGVLQFVQDHDGTLDFTEESLKHELAPYTRNAELWTAPGDDDGIISYSFNGNLFGLRLGQLGPTDKIVSFYLGRDEKPEFRYDGLTVVGFVDGHVEYLNAEQAKNLRWKP